MPTTYEADREGRKRLQFDDAELEALATYRDAAREELRAHRELNEKNRLYAVGSSQRHNAAKAWNRARDRLLRSQRELTEMLLAGDV